MKQFYPYIGAPYEEFGGITLNIDHQEVMRSEVKVDTFEHLPGGRSKVIGHETTCDCGFDWLN